MLSAIMTSPEFGEICFLVAFVLFVIASIVGFVRTEVSGYVGAIVASGLALLALGWLAL